MRLRRWLSFAFLFVLLVPSGYGLSPEARRDARAQADCVAEREPNDVPDDAVPLDGAVCFSGALPDGDQDIWLWNLSTAEAAQPVSITVEGVAETSTSLKIVSVASPANESPIVPGNQIFEVATTLDEARAVAENILVPPGRYLLGVVRTPTASGEPPAAIDYEVRIERGRDVPERNEEEPNDDAASANPLTAEFAIAGDNAGSVDVFAWTIGAEDAARGWQLDGAGAIGSTLYLDLRDAEGNALGSYASDGLGHVSVRDIALEPGTYLIVVGSASDTASPYVLRAVPQERPEYDFEPNDGQHRASALATDRPVAKGRIDHTGDVDWFRLPIAGELAASQFDLKLLWRSGANRKLCLMDESGFEVQCRGGTSGVVLANLLLPPGDYFVTVSGDPDLGDTYLVRIDVTSEPSTDFESEPNDAVDVATVMGVASTMRGRLDGAEDDYFKLIVDGDPQLWVVTAAGTGIGRIALVQAGGTELMSGDVAPDGTSATLNDLFLTPGPHWIRVGGADGDYAITLTPLGPPDPDAEREPNNYGDFAEPLFVDRPRTGRIAGATDLDVFRFFLAATEHIAIKITPPADGAVAMRLASGDVGIVTVRTPAVGEPLVYDAFLSPGDYELWLYAGAPSEEDYSIELERLDPFLLGDDQEPNDTPRQARPIPPSLTVSGTVGLFGDDDWYLLPPTSEVSLIAISGDGEISSFGLSDGITDYPLSLDGDGTRYVSERVAPGVPLWMRVSGYGAYTVTVAYASGPAPVAPPAESPLELELALDVDRVAAYWKAGQRVNGVLTIRSRELLPQLVSLVSETSHYGWTVELSQSEVVLGGRREVAIPLSVSIQPDAWADLPVRITVAAQPADGVLTTAFASVVPDRDALPVNPEQRWSVPEMMLGGLDVASPSLGAAVIATIDPAGEALLHDDISPVGSGFRAGFTGEPIALTVDLAGDGPVPIAGIVLNPQGGNGFVGERPREVEFWTSLDGTDFTLALEATLSPLPIDQPFALPAPADAAFARLVIKSTYADSPSSVVLGEWSVVATPGFNPTGGPFNIADPALGGHVVWMDPQSNDVAAPESLLSEDPTPLSLRPAAGARPSWVIGFQHNRMARIERLEWVDPVDPTTGGRFDLVEIAVSATSPLGPWEELGTWELLRSTDGSVEPFEFDVPPWARFIRFVGNGPDVDGIDWQYPATLRVFESPTGDAYRSVFATWGQDSPQAIYDLLHPPELAVSIDADDPGDTPDEAVPLVPDTDASGQVHVDVDVDWYSVEAPMGSNTLSFVVNGTPTVGVKLTLYDARETQVPMRFAPAGDGGVEYVATVTPGASYALKVEQPPRSVVFAFDTSTSLAGYQAYVQSGMRSFVAGVTPGQEFVSIIPFDEDPLLDEWSDQPYELQSAINGYVDRSLSSSAETGLIDGSDLLAGREGARAILIVTDAETSSFDRSAELWRTMGAVRPIVFSVHVGGSSTPIRDRHFMEDWASASGGFYQYVSSHGEMDRAFDRLATWLRRPAGYTVAFSASTEEPATATPMPTPTAEPAPTATPEVTPTPGATAETTPAPAEGTERGSLRIVSAGTDRGDGGAPYDATVAVEIILDTSGSMLQEIEPGARRIDVAKRVLIDLLAGRLPPGAPVALRIFGSQPDSCETVLASPLQPLDPVAVTSQIEGIQVVNLVRTPIGFALEQVAADLAGVDGPKIVVLVTDGEETCGGDPAAAIRSLIDQGIDVQVNIVGFALDDDALKETFRAWARIGNGSYFDATNADELDEAIAKAVSAPFRVYDDRGTLVASGTVDGRSIRLQPGTYTVVVLTDPEIRFEEVVVDAGERTTLTLGE